MQLAQGITIFLVGTPVPLDQLEAMGPLSTSIWHLHTVLEWDRA
jgi:hypothetical protein